MNSPDSMLKRENTSFVIVVETCENVIFSENDFLPSILYKDAPYTPPTTTITLSSNGILTQTFIGIVIGTSAVVVVILYCRYERS
ncbi:MAG: hypothetical protein JW779_14885 [Candidatus Thorarchaeota archaeon]|nr:hypothetical protein [Candidatus Thorarchaeota archaeon]